MAARQLLFHDEARAKICRGVDTLAAAVAATLGPRGRTVILVRDYGAPQIVNSGLRIVARALEAPLRRIVANPGGEPSVVLQRVDVAAEPSRGYNAATRENGDLLQMGVIDPAKVSRLALQNAASIAALLLTTGCMIANAPPPRSAAGGAGAAAELPGF